MFILKIIEWLGRERVEKDKETSMTGEDIAFLVTIIVMIGGVMLLDVLL